MSTSEWCDVQLTNPNTKAQVYYHFVLNKTFAYWCEEKDTNKPIGKTIDAVLNNFQSSTRYETTNPLIFKTRVLNLSNKGLEDISPLASLLQMRSLWLDNNHIHDINAIGSLKNLVFLSLNHNSISDTHILYEMTGLKWLFLNSNQIENVGFAEDLKNLKFLALKNNNISNPNPLFAASPSTYIVVNNNPFLKKMCSLKKNNLSSHKSKEKNCFELAHSKNMMYLTSSY